MQCMWVALREVDTQEHDEEFSRLEWIELTSEVYGRPFTTADVSHFDRPFVQIISFHLPIISHTSRNPSSLDSGASHEERGTDHSGYTKSAFQDIKLHIH